MYLEYFPLLLVGGSSGLIIDVSFKLFIADVLSGYFRTCSCCLGVFSNYARIRINEHLVISKILLSNRFLIYPVIDIVHDSFHIRCNVAQAMILKEVLYRRLACTLNNQDEQLKSSQDIIE